jgi:NAD(P)-dependent dehydrogenase (short-subunit alcohol dehydrogenase family)
MLITGAARGIGRATAIAAAAAGARVALVDLDGLGVRRTMHDIVGAGGTAMCVEADVASPRECAAALAEIEASAVGAPDILVNNAGVQIVGPFLALDRAAWERTLAVNFEAPARLTQSIARGWVSRGVPGVVVNLASIAGTVQFPGHVAYSCSKAALRALTAAAALELAVYGIRVNAVAPGHVNTEMSLVARDPAALEERLRRIPLRRLALPHDIATVVIYLASSRAAYITGQTVTVDGGYTLQ